MITNDVLYKAGQLLVPALDFSGFLAFRDDVCVFSLQNVAHLFVLSANDCL